jgi:hypothetical protein
VWKLRLRVAIVSLLEWTFGFVGWCAASEYSSIAKSAV